MKKNLLIFVTEEPTSEDFYRRLLREIRRRNENRPSRFSKIDFMSASGISRFDNKLVSKFQQQYCSGRYATYEKTVCLCYDKEAFDHFSIHPRIDWNFIKTRMRALGVSTIIEIKADKMIEDYFLYDLEGIKRFLLLDENYSIPPGVHSLEALETLYRKANHIYVKGEKAEGLVLALDYRKIMSFICSDISPLCDALGYHCKRDKCRALTTDSKKSNS
jgi:hypothetical protein